MSRRILSLLLLTLCLFSAAAPASAAGGVADASQMAGVNEVGEPGMVPVYAEELLDGEYAVEFESSSSMFRIESALLKVEEGAMEVTLTMGSKSFLYVYPGSAEDAAGAGEDAWTKPVLNAEGAMAFTLPINALDAPVPCAAYSKSKELWYDRTLLFRADSLPLEAYRPGTLTTAESLGLSDGDYTAAVQLSGGSGKARVESPARLHVEGGVCTAEITWGSKNYDYMKVGGEQLFPVNTEGNARFVIPVPCFDRGFAVVADTVAMSEPHEIRYTLRFDSDSLEAAA